MNPPQVSATAGKQETQSVLLDVRKLSRVTPSGASLLHPVSFSICPGDLIVCQGNSGAGKTVLLRALAKLDAMLGEIDWRGNTVSKQRIPEFRSQVMYLQQQQQLSEGTVRDAIQEPFTWTANQAARYDERRHVKWLEPLNRKASFLDAQTNDLSGGESQIVALLRALQLDPTILLLDEPTSALDDATIGSVETWLTHWLADSSRAIVWVTHNQQQAERLATRRFQVEAGKVSIDV